MSDMNQHLDEGTIHAWLDGALSPDESARIESHAMCVRRLRRAGGGSARAGRGVVADPVVAGRGAGGRDSRTVTPALTNWPRCARARADASIASLVARSPVRCGGVAGVRGRGIECGVALRRNPAADGVSRRWRVVVRCRDGYDWRRREVATPRRGACMLLLWRASREVATAEAAPLPSPPSPSAGWLRIVAADSAVAQKVATSAGDGCDTGRRVASSQRGPPSERARNCSQRSATRSRLRSSGARSTQQRAERRVQRRPPPALARDRANAAVVRCWVRAFGRQTPRPPRPAPATGCGRSRLASSRAALVPDTVQLLDETVPERSDPSWLRARAVGRPDASADLAWRSVDSITVELRLVNESAGHRASSYGFRATSGSGASRAERCRGCWRATGRVRAALSVASGLPLSLAGRCTVTDHCPADPIAVQRPHHRPPGGKRAKQRRRCSTSRSATR